MEMDALSSRRLVPETEKFGHPLAPSSKHAKGRQSVCDATSIFRHISSQLSSVSGSMSNKVHQPPLPSLRSCPPKRTKRAPTLLRLLLVLQPLPLPRACSSWPSLAQTGSRGNSKLDCPGNRIVNSTCAQAEASQFGETASSGATPQEAGENKTSQGEDGNATATAVSPCSRKRNGQRACDAAAVAAVAGGGSMPSAPLLPPAVCSTPATYLPCASRAEGAAPPVASTPEAASAARTV